MYQAHIPIQLNYKVDLFVCLLSRRNTNNYNLVLRNNFFKKENKHFSVELIINNQLCSRQFLHK